MAVSSKAVPVLTRTWRRRSGSRDGWGILLKYLWRMEMYNRLMKKSIIHRAIFMIGVGFATLRSGPYLASILLRNASILARTWVTVISLVSTLVLSTRTWRCMPWHS